MSTILDKGSHQEVGQGVKDFAEDIKDLLAFSDKPQRYKDIREHFREDDNYFEQDLDYLQEAIDYLEGEDEIKRDFRLDTDFPVTAYSVTDYDSI